LNFELIAVINAFTYSLPLLGRKSLFFNVNKSK
jgi:hypothetical protein